MRIIALIFVATWISSLTACHGMYGNVVPKTGPTMEQVYDGMNTIQSVNAMRPGRMPESSPQGRESIASLQTGSWHSSQNDAYTAHGSNHGFQKISNPELTLYVFPHLAGESEIPIPGYTTVFNAYEKNHYLSPQDTVRE